MAHALDFDDTLDFAGNIHVGASVVPAALAMAEQTGGVTGAQLLTAIASGIEMSCRLAAIAHEDLGWHRTGAFGIFGYSFVLLLFTEIAVRYTGINQSISLLFLILPFILTIFFYFFLIIKFKNESKNL